MKIRMPIENKNGNLIGELTLEEDGSFSGKFRPNSAIADVLGALSKGGFVNGLIIRPKYVPVWEENMSRNQFENNDEAVPNVSSEDKEFLGDRLYVPLPHLQDGHRYDIAKLPSGESAVVINKEAEPTEDEVVEHMHKHDQFGRRYARGSENG